MREINYKIFNPTPINRLTSLHKKYVLISNIYYKMFTPSYFKNTKKNNKHINIFFYIINQKMAVQRDRPSCTIAPRDQVPN